MNHLKTSAQFKKVMVIDDNQIDRYIIETVIKKAGFAEEVISRESARSALKYLEEYANNHEALPQVIFLDINMPAMDGWEFLTQYKMLTKKATKTIVIVMLTTSLNPDDEMKSKEIKEVYGYRNKPLTRLMLEEIAIKYF